uniref:Vitellogenin 3, phosvitinless n=1 Tax=Sphaeramia orbicularis TaxID=375764 RepID=A0A673CLL0_9TELE
MGTKSVSDLILNPSKTYEYQYEGTVNFGLGDPRFVESGVKMVCKVKIAGVSDHTFSLQVSDLSYEEFNGIQGRDRFIKSAGITNLITAQLAKPFMFDYAGGHVNNIYASADVSETVVNIIRGILSFFQVTVKTTEKIYDLEEIGIHGKCQSNYAVEEDTKTTEYRITQVVDVSNCREKAALFTGIATAVLDDVSKQRGESIFSTVRYIYNIKPEHGGHVTRAEALEQEFFTPFNVMGGNFRMKSKKEIVLVSVVQSAARGAVGGQDSMESRGNIVFKFGNVGTNVPIMMKKVNDPVQEAVDLIERLAQVHLKQVDNANTEQVIRLYQLMRMVPIEGMKSDTVQVSKEHLHWFLITAVEANNDTILKFLKERFNANDLEPFEALFTVLLTFNHLEASAEMVEMAKEFLGFPISNEYVRNTVVMAYGSLVNKHCAYNTPCPDAAVQPLLEMANKALVAKNNKDMVLVLKALGNAGHPGSIKTIMKFLPGVAANPVDLPPSVLSAAVQAMRLIAARDPHHVQDISVELFFNKNLSSEIRMLAFIMLVDTKPSMALVSTVTTHLMEDTDLHVGSFAYSYLYSLAKSKTPENHFLSTACTTAMKILAPKFGRLGYYYSKAARMDVFNDKYLLGLAAEGFMLKNEPYVMPSEMRMRGKLFFIGRILQTIEFGIRNEGIKELFGKEIPGFKGDFSFGDFLAILNILKKWEHSPDNKPIFSASTRLSGQEWFFTDINKDFIRNIINVRQIMTYEYMNDMSTKPGISWHKAMPLLMADARYIKASCVGLPVEISKYYQVLNGLSVNAMAEVNPPQTGIMDSEVLLKTEGFIGYTKDLWLFYGINTKLFQSGAELKAKSPISFPWKFDATVNIKEKKYSLEFIPSSNEVEFFSFRSDVYAVSRNIEDEGKTTPMIPSSGEAANSTTWSVMRNPQEICAESDAYGIGVCLESEFRKEYRPEQYPLYYLLGYTRFGLKVKKAQAARAVDRIRFEVNGTNPMGMCQLFNTQTKLFQVFRFHFSVIVAAPRLENVILLLLKWVTSESCTIVKAVSMNANEVSDGYEAQMVYKYTDSQSIGQMVVSQAREDSNWKMSAETTMNVADTKAVLKWGVDCKPYEVSVETSSTKERLNAMLAWKVLPDTLAEAGQIIGRFIRHLAFFFGFNWELETNTEKQLTASVVGTSANYYNVEMKFPEVLQQTSSTLIFILETPYPMNETLNHV